jgi:hypothetical protein
MGATHQEKEPLGGGVRFMALSCWLTVVICSIEVVFGLYDKPGDVIEIFMAGLALYVALAIHARSNSARLVLIVILAAGAGSTVLLSLIRICEFLAGSESFREASEIASFVGLYVFAPVLVVCASCGLLNEVRGEPTRSQFAGHSQDGGLADKEAEKERKAIWIGLGLGFLVLFLQI